MDGTEREGVVEAEFYVRSDLPRPSQRRAEAVAAELESLAADDAIDEFHHRSWEKRVPVDRCESAVRDVYLKFVDWATHAGVSLQPFFDTRECYCPEAETHTDWLVVPTFTLAIAVDGDLAGVYPHADGDRTMTVEDGVAALCPGKDGPGDRGSPLAD